MGKNFLLQLLTQNRIAVYISTVLLFFSAHLYAEENIELQPVVITSTRIETEIDAGRAPLRSQDSIVLEEENATSYFSVPSALKKNSLVDVRTRGPYGVQADISLRGAPYEENLVLLDGVNLNDPKSGHHNMDLPLTMYDIERMDITYGPASSVYGSGPMGGAINIIPRDPGKKFGISLSSATGSWDFYSGGVSLDLPLAPFTNRTSVEWRRGTGYMPETEFDILTTSSYTKANFEGTEFDVFLGYLTKKFGADSFYSDRYPNEEESINTGLLITKGKLKGEGVSFAPTFYLKRGQDKFILDRNRESFSRNDHTTYLFGGEISSQVDTPLGEVVFGGGVGNEEISSTNLGDRSRTKVNAFLEYERRVLGFLVNANGRWDHYSTFGSEFSPSVNIGYEVFPYFTLRSGVAYAFRAPTFTELYYSSPANRGNPDLKPEKAWLYEAGFNYAADGITASGTAFLRNTEKAIDWTREAGASIWQVENIGELDIYGLEGLLKLELSKFNLDNITLKYTYLEALDKKGFTSKYVLEYLKHNLNLYFNINLPFGITEEVNFAFRKRVGSKEYFLLDSTLYKDVEFKEGKATFFIKLNNIFDTNYAEQNDVEMPGFAAFAGASAKF